MASREEAKNRIKAGSKGGPPGVWSARKAQLLGSYCKKNGCSLDRNSKAAKSMKKWTKESWRTSDGSPSRKEGRKSVKRYRPDKVWKKLDKKEKASLNRSKTVGDKKGKAVVSLPKKLKKKAAVPKFKRKKSKKR